MKFKRILSVVLSAALITSTTSLSVFARGGEKKYDYVALGDSIAAGFGLSGASGQFVGPAQGDRWQFGQFSRSVVSDSL